MTAPKDILTHTVDIAVNDGTTMRGYVARPTAPGPFPGVVVAMELFGVSAHVRDVCEQLAVVGFVALAPDLYHRTAPGVELAEDAAGRERGFDLLHQQTREQVLRDIAAAIDRLHADGSAAVGMVGLSVGGHVAYLAATEFDLPAVAVIYGGWLPTTDIPLGRPEPTLTRTPRITGRLLILVGQEDQVVPPEHRRQIADALQAAGVRHEIITYPGVAHGFLSDRRATYNRTAAHDTWQRVQDLLTAELLIRPDEANSPATSAR
jgi:carboxymethylenebutenolidase